MQNDHSTRLNPDTLEAVDFDRADDLLMALGETCLDGMSPYQRRLIGKIGEMLSASVSIIDKAEAAAGFEVTMLVRKASNVALAMRMHDGVIRGVDGAALLEDLCDVATGRFISEAIEIAREENQADKLDEGISVEYAMKLVGARSYNQLAKLLKTSVSMVRYWREKGFVSPKKTALIMELSSQKVAA